MTPKTLPKHLLNILVSLIAVAVLGTLGCSSSVENPVGAGFDSPQELTSNAPDNSGLDEDIDRDAQIFWYEYDESCTEPNNTPAEASQVYHAQAYHGHVDQVTDQNDYFRIELPIWPASIYVKLGWLGDAWLNFFVYEEDMTPVIYSDWDVPGPKQFFCYQLDPGTYYVRVKAFEGASDYLLKIGVGRQWDEPANDTIETTFSLIEGAGTGNEPIRSVVSETEDQNDYYIVEVLEGQYVQAKLDWLGLPNADLNVFLYDVDYTPIVHSSTSACPEAFRSEILPEGTYYIRVKAVTSRAIYELNVDVYSLIMPPWDDLFYPEEIFPWPPFTPVPDFDLPFDPDAYMGPMEGIPPQFYMVDVPGSWFDEGQPPEMPQMPEFGF